MVQRFLEVAFEQRKRMCNTALNAAHTRRRSEETAGSSIFVSSGLVPKTSSILGTGHGYVNMEVAPAEPLHQDACAKFRGVDTESADWCYKLGLVHREQEDDPEDMPQRAEWIGDENLFLGDSFTKKDGLVVRSAPGRYLEFVVGPNRKKVGRRKLSRGSENGCESERPMNDLINLLPDECLYEIFRSLSRARDRCAVAAVCRRWLLLLTTMPRSCLRARLSNMVAMPSLEQASSRVADSMTRCGLGDGDGRVERQPQWAMGDLTRKLEGRKATDVRLASIAVGTAGRGGVGELVIRGGPGMPMSKAVSDVGLTAIGMSCGALRRLSLWQCLNVGDEGLTAIGRGCRLLEKLDLMKCPGIGDTGMKAVAEGCPLLSNISLDSCKGIGNEGLKSVGRSSSGLVSLSISNCEVGSEGICAVVLSCRKLKKMKLEKVSISDAGLAQVGEHAKSLVKLRLSNLKNVTEAGFLALGQSSCLQELRAMCVSACHGLSDVALQVVGASCKELRVFSLLSCEAVSDMGLKAITKSCLALESLHVEGCSGITHVGLNAALANRGGELRTLRLSNCGGVRDKGLTSSDFLLTCNVLKSLSITNCIGVGNGCLRMVGRSCPSLEELDLSGLTGVSDRGLEVLMQGAGGRLQKLKLSGCVKVSDQGVCAVARHCGGSLRCLILEGCTKVTDRSLKVLAMECRGIEDLDVSKCGVTDEGVEAVLSENGKALKSLSLAGCKLITDKSLYAVGNGVCSDSFWALNVKQCKGLSREALDVFETRFFSVLLCRS